MVDHDYAKLAEELNAIRCYDIMHGRNPVSHWEDLFARATAALRAAEQDRKDAERYRWFRSASVYEGTLSREIDSDWWGNLGDLLGAEFEASVDSARAMSEEKQHG